MSKTAKVWSTQDAMNGAKSNVRSRRVPHQFVLDAIAEINSTTRAMFGALAIYVGDKIVFILRDRPNDPDANGVWLAIPAEFQQSLRADFPNAGPVRVMGKEISGWWLLAIGADDFEASALHACQLVIKRDPRIGNVPRSKKRQRKTP